MVNTQARIDAMAQAYNRLVDEHRLTGLALSQQATTGKIDPHLFTALLISSEMSDAAIAIVVSELKEVAHALH